MEKAYRTYMKAEGARAEELLFGDWDKRAEIYKNDGKFEIELSVFEPKENGYVRHVIPSEELARISKQRSSFEVMDKFLELKRDGKMYIRFGRVDDPISYFSVNGVKGSDGSYPPVPFFRDNEDLKKYSDICDYISKTGRILENHYKGLMSTLEHNSYPIGYGKEQRLLSIYYTMSDTPVPLTTSKAVSYSEDEIKRVSDITGIDPENGQYNKGFSFVPIYALDSFSYEAGALFSSNEGPIRLSSPYVYNFRNSEGKVKHDVVLDPVSAADIIERSHILKSRSDGVFAEGVYRAYLVEYPRKNNPPLYDNVYLYSEDDIIGLYNNISGVVNRVFRSPVHDEGFTKLSLRDIQNNPRAKKGQIRSLAVFSDAENFKPYFLEKPRAFNKKGHDIYVKDMIKSAYMLKNNPKVFDTETNDNSVETEEIFF